MKVRDEILLVVILVVVVFSAVVLGMGDYAEENNSSNTQIFRVGYSETLTPFVVDSDGEAIEPEDQGKQFYVVRYTIANADVSSGIDTGYYGDLSWKVNYDKVAYGSSVVSKSLPEYNPCTIKAGGHATSVIVFEVPTGKTLDDLSFTVYYGKGQKLVWSHDLDPEAYVAELPEVIPDVRIGWTATLAKTVTSYKHSSWSYTAPEGRKVLLITFTLANDHYGEGVDIGYSGSLDWSVIYEHRENSDGHYCCKYLQAYSVETIHVGGVGTSVAALEVPDNVPLDELEIKVVDFWGKFTISYDETLNPKSTTDSGSGPSSGSSSVEPVAGRIRVNYSALMSTQVYDNGKIRAPGDGMKFALLTYAAINDTNSTISTSQSVWKWTLVIDGTSYSAKSYGTVGHNDCLSISPGKAGYQILVFEVPESASITDISYSYQYRGSEVTIVRDQSFKVPVPVDAFYGTSLWSTTIRWTDPTA